MPEETEAEKQEARLALLAPVRRVRNEDTGEEVAFVRVGRGAVLGLEVLPSYLCAPGAGAWRNDTAGGVVGTPARATVVVVEDVKATCFSAFAFPDVVRAADATAEAAMGFIAHSSLLQVKVVVVVRRVFTLLTCVPAFTRPFSSTLSVCLWAATVFRCGHDEQGDRGPVRWLASRTGEALQPLVSLIYDFMTWVCVCCSFSCATRAGRLRSRRPSTRCDSPPTGRWPRRASGPWAWPCTEVTTFPSGPAAVPS
jgi:hypothetical protein